MILIPVLPAALSAAELQGKVTDVAGDLATVAIEGSGTPSIGDKADIYFKLGDAEVSVATGKVTESTTNNAKVKIEKATGHVAKAHLVRFAAAGAPQPAGFDTPAPATASSGATSPLRGDWIGNAPDGSKISFSFKEDNSLVWIVEDLPSGIITYIRAKYRTDTTKTPHRVELFDIEEGDLKGETARGVFELQADGRLKYDMSIGHMENPSAGFTDGAVQFYRAASPIVVPAEALSPDAAKAAFTAKAATSSPTAALSAPPVDPTPDPSKSPDEQQIAIGDARNDRKDFAGAVKAYSKAIELNPKNAYAYFRRGFALDKTGDLDGAIADWKKFMQMEPKNEINDNLRTIIKANQDSREADKRNKRPK